MIEFQNWYMTGQQIVRCGGDGGCGALLLDGDTDVHVKFHEEVTRAADLSRKAG